MVQLIDLSGSSEPQSTDNGAASTPRNPVPAQLAGKAFVHTGSKWMPVTDMSILQLNLAQLMQGNVRFIAELTIGDGKFFLCSHERDEEAMRLKHPGKPVCNFRQLIGFFRKSVNDERMLEVLPKIFMLLAEFPDGTIVK